MNDKIKEYVKRPSAFFRDVWKQLAPLVKNDKIYLGVNYFITRHKKMHWDNPRRFNEKLQWLKIHCDDPMRKLLVDKYEVKKVLQERIGEKYIIPTLGVWDNFDDINFDKLPDQFVLKTTHDSGGIVICNNKDNFDMEKARKKINHHLKRDYYKSNREYGYQFVKPRVLAEEYKVDESGWQLKDYKVFCFNGEPKFVEVDYDRYVGHKLNVYDLDWNFVDFYMTSHNDANVKIPKPNNLDEIVELSKKLAKNETFVRIDFYSIGDQIYVGELTFYPGGGCIDFHPDQYDYILGDMLELPKA